MGSGDGNVTEMVEQNVLDANGDPVMRNVTEMVEQNVLDANGDPVMRNVTEMVEVPSVDANGNFIIDDNASSPRWLSRMFWTPMVTQ